MNPDCSLLVWSRNRGTLITFVYSARRWRSRWGWRVEKCGVGSRQQIGRIDFEIDETIVEDQHGTVVDHVPGEVPAVVRIASVVRREKW